MSKWKCTDCHVNEAEYELANGYDVQRLCRPSLESKLYDLVTESSGAIVFTLTDRKGLLPLITVE